MSPLAHNSITGHAVIVPAPAHGHWPSLILFTVKLIKARPGTVFTILVVGEFLEKIGNALDLYFTEEEAKLRENIRVVKIGGEGIGPFEALVPNVFQNSVPYFASLTSSSDIVCKTGKTYPGIKAPDCFIIDFFYNGMIDMIRSTTQLKFPIYAWYSGNTASMLRFKSADEGGWGDAAGDAPDLAKQLNKSVEEVSYDMYYPSKGEVRNIPGCPPMYDYEYHTERPPLSIALGVVQLGIGIHRILRECDGVLAISDDALEPEANDILRAWFAETNRSAYLFGPLIPKEHEAVSEVTDFLSRMQSAYGEHSVLYISTGTFFSPQGPGFQKIMEVLLDIGVPLVYSSAAGAKLSAELIERLNQSDRVFTSSWVPQRAILAHLATGAFLTHGGQNSFTEAVSAGVPLIVYPITVDQPLVAALVSLKFKIGYELLEIRTGIALRPAYRGVHPTGTPEAIEKEIRDVISKAFGPDGEEKRRNTKSLGEKRNAAWDEQGSSRKDLEKFIRENFPQIQL